MQEVNIYIATTAKGPAVKKKVYYSYVLECAGREDNAKKKEGELENVTQNQAELITLIKAFQRFNKSCSVRVFTRCEHVLGSMNNHWAVQWEKNGWKKQNGKTVKNAELWQQFMNLVRRHAVTFTDEPHKYSDWQEFELKKLKEKYDEK